MCPVRSVTHVPGRSKARAAVAGADGSPATWPTGCPISSPSTGRSGSSSRKPPEATTGCRPGTRPSAEKARILRRGGMEDIVRVRSYRDAVRGGRLAGRARGTPTSRRRRTSRLQSRLGPDPSRRQRAFSADPLLRRHRRSPGLGALGRRRGRTNPRIYEEIGELGLFVCRSGGSRCIGLVRSGGLPIVALPASLLP